MFVFNITKENIVEHGDSVDVEYSVFQRNEIEIDELRRGPDKPVS